MCMGVYRGLRTFSQKGRTTRPNGEERVTRDAAAAAPITARSPLLSVSLELGDGDGAVGRKVVQKAKKPSPARYLNPVLVCLG